MINEVFFFTEMGYTGYSQEVAAQYGYTNLMFPNENFSPEKAAKLYSQGWLEYHTGRRPAATSKAAGLRRFRCLLQFSPA